MKKKVLLLILFLLLFPSMVFAKDTCNNNDIKIEEIKVEEKEGYTEELTPVNIDNNKINLNIEMYTVGESITYKIKIKNNSNNDYYFTKDSFNLNTDYIEYGLLNNSEIIKPNEEEEIELKIIYKNKIPEDEFTENNRMSITLSDTPLSNPSTKRSLILILLVISITSVVIFINKKKKLSKVLMGILICSIPLSIKALCTINLEINANITINEKEAIFLPGPEVNTIMKQLAGDDTSTVTEPYRFQDVNITAIKYSNTEPEESEKEEKNIVSIIDSPYPIYMWYEEGTIYWWSEAKRPNLNEDASYMFSSLTNLDSLLSLSKFNTSNTKNMTGLFFNLMKINDLSGLENWDVSNVENLSATFMSTTSLTSIEALEKWNVKNVTSLYGLFCRTKITSLKGLEKWDVSNVKIMESIFLSTKSLESLDSLKDWNVSNLTNLNQAFAMSGISSLKGLENWDTSHVTNMRRIFSETRINNLQALRNWNVENVTNYTQAFLSIRSLTDASAINDWNIQSIANFHGMFDGVPTHPEFSKVPGTWRNGAFIPS